MSKIEKKKKRNQWKDIYLNPVLNLSSGHYKVKLSFKYIYSHTIFNHATWLKRAGVQCMCSSRFITDCKYLAYPSNPQSYSSHNHFVDFANWMARQYKSPNMSGLSGEGLTNSFSRYMVWLVCSNVDYYFALLPWKLFVLFQKDDK